MHNRRLGGRQAAARLFLLPSLAGTMWFVVVPFADVVRRSFVGSYSGKFIGLENYRTVFENGAFRLAAANTCKFIFVCIPLLLFLSLCLSLMVNGTGRARRVFQAAFLIPMAVPVASVVLFWRLMFDYHGYLNRLTGLFGMAPVDWMNSGSAFGILVFCYIWKNAGYFMVLWLAGINAIPQEYYEAARVDGANSRKCFLYITLPQLVPTCFVVVILAFVNSFKVFREAYLIAGDYPHESIYFIQHLFNNWFAGLDVQKMSAAAVLLALVVGLVILALRRLLPQEG